MTEQQQTSPTVIHRIFTALMVLGVSGAGKTSLLATFADYLWETYGRILLLYSWDGGAIPTDIQRRIQQGLIRFWRVRTRSAPGLALESLYLGTKGYWPRRIDPRTGEVSPAVDLVAPVTVKYEMSFEGVLLKTVPSASLVKPMLKPGGQTMIQVHEMQVKEIATRTKGFELVGGVAFDGLTSMAEVVMNFQDQQRGLGLIGGEKSSFGGVVRSGDLAFGGNNRADVGFAQTRAAQFVSNSLSIPYLVESPVFTGLSTEGTDKGGLSIIGVDLPGQAALTQAPQWYGNIVEADKWSDTDGKEHFILNLQPFTDAQGRRHLLKTSASPWGVPDRLVDPSRGEGQPFSEFNLGKVFKLLDADLQRSLEQQSLSGVPGVPDGMMDYGEPAKVEAPAGTGAPKPSVGAVASPPVRAGNPAPPAGRPVASAPPQAAAPKPAVAAVAPLNSVPTPSAASLSQGVSGAGSAPPPPGRPPMRAPGAPEKK